MEFYAQPLEKIFARFHTSLRHGLQSAQVIERQELYGRNVLQQENKETWLQLLIRQFSGVLIYILIAAAGISALQSDWAEVLTIIAILVINGVIGFWQEWKARASIQALRRMVDNRATVIRDGHTKEVNAEDLVPGDVLLLQTGDRISADARLFETQLLEANESALTGESMPVSKASSILGGKLPLGDQSNMVFLGTLVTKGQGKAVVVATGMKTYMGSIAHLIQQSKIEQTPLQKELDRMGSFIAKATLSICIIVFLFILLRLQESLALAQFLDALKLGVALAVAAIPEGLPIVVTIALAYGTQRMLAKKALVKRLSAVEALGSTTAICTDKTGTLTKNEMTVTALWFAGNFIDVTGVGYRPQGSIAGTLPPIAYYVATLCNDAQLSEQAGSYVIVGDPTEGCLLTLASKAGYDAAKLTVQHPRLNEIPFSSARKRMSTIHSFGKHRLLLTKGAPDVILEHCRYILEIGGVRALTESDRRAILMATEHYAQQALRLLSFAYKSVESKEIYEEVDERDLIFVCLVGIIDPPREEAIAAVKKCKDAGIRVIMITGDHKGTALAIAEKLGIAGDAVEGLELETIDLQKEVEHINVYARVNPEHKVRIVDALQMQGHIVAMTGDGVNDAPALKAADIGVAMGAGGTDVAKESASMILIDDNFSNIVQAVEEGRNIYLNLKKFVNYLLSSNAAEVFVIFLSVLLFTREGEIIYALTPIMLLYVNVLTDSLPALALGVDPGDPEIMQRQPRKPGEPIINRNMFYNIIGIGLLLTVSTLIIFAHTLTSTSNVAYAQTMALTALVVLELVRLAMIRKQYRTPFFSNKWMLAAIIGVMLMQFAALYIPWLASNVFGLVPLTSGDWMLIISVATVTYMIGLLLGWGIRKVTGQFD